MIAENLKNMRRRIARACAGAGRRLEDVELVAVTKEAAVADINEALACGVRMIGENRVQDALAKHREIGGRAEWHMIGHLQTNKARDAVSVFSLIHSVDSARLAGVIDKEAKRIGKVQDVLVEVNTSGEASKFGMAPDGLKEFLSEAASYTNIHVRGLMTMAPESADPEEARPYFRRLRELRDKLNRLPVTGYRLRILSMGMSNDFEAAISEGSTMVRIGRAIFGHT